MEIGKLEVEAYRLDDNVTIEKATSVTWKIKQIGGFVYSKKGNWDYEPLPSNRTDKWLKQHRWNTAQAALNFYIKTQP